MATWKLAELTYLKVWLECEEEGFSCAIEAITDLEGLGRQCTKHLVEQEQMSTRQKQCQPGTCIKHHYQ